MISEQEIVETALRNFEAHTGIKGEWVPVKQGPDKGFDGQALLTIRESRLAFNTEVKREFREYHMEKLLSQANSNQPFMLIAEKLFPAQKQRLRQLQIAYLDTAGNGHITAGDVFLWIDGQKAVYQGDEPTKTNRAFTKAGLKVVFALLQNHSAVNYTYREIATYAGVALGTIKEAMLALKEAGYLLRVNKDRMILDNKKQLLENWLAGYGNMLKPSLLMGSYIFRDAASWKAIQLPTGAMWGGEPAGELKTGHLIPAQWTIYTKGGKNELAKALQLAPKQNGNLKIYRKFWTDVSVGHVIHATPDLITYADLLLTGESRCIETANIIYEEKLSKVFDT